MRIRDVASRAGVGVATVSRVLNGRAHVAGPTKERVLTAMRELDYRPSSIARNLSFRRTMVVGVVVPFLTSPSAVERVRGIVEVLAASDYDLALYDVESEDRRRRAFELLGRPDRTDGLLVVSLIPDAAAVARLQAARIPCVLVDGSHPHLPHVISDDVHGGELATRHLLELGHRRIALIGDKPPDPYRLGGSRDRTSGYQRALAQAGVASRPDYLRGGTQSREEARAIAEELLGLPDPPTAVFACSDVEALGVLEAAAALGLHVPGDVSIVGFDDIEIASYVGLTTIRQPLLESGRRGAALLLATLAGGGATVSEELGLELVARRTTGPPPKHDR
ncbi:MAG TPA: LacI family DNA-binding transcriptional regulator [Gaiellaceae bacterium]|nr:LacI family DNA-binding transcriptional regulator [Gaiellaceae bacterium]